MTIEECLATIDELKPNAFTTARKKEWLYQLDQKIYNEVITQHDMTDVDEFTPYDDNTSTSTELLVIDPYSRLYISYLESQIDYYNGEYNRYNNTATMFNNDYDEYKKWYVRHYMPNETKINWG